MLLKKLGCEVLNSIRHEKICNMVNERGAIRIKDLTKAFPDVTPMTIYRDLAYLEEIGAIIRVRGGAMSPNSTTELKYEVREFSNSALKGKIAEKAVKLIKAKSSVFLDAGTTVTALAKLIPDMELSVFTTAPNIAIKLADLNNPSVEICGGKLNKMNLALSGSRTVRDLENINIDTAFIGVAGYSTESGFTCGVEGESLVKQVILKKARVRVALMDSSKLSVVLPYTFAHIEDFTHIVSDGNLPEDVVKLIEEKNVILI